MKRIGVYTAYGVVIVMLAILLTLLIWPGNDLDHVCVGWLARCHVDWEAVGAVFAGLAAVGAAAAAWQARHAAQVALDIETRRNGGDGAIKANRREFLAAIVRTELSNAKEQAELLLKFGVERQLVPFQIAKTVTRHRQMLDLPITIAHTTELDVFPARTATPIAFCAAQSRSIQHFLEPAIQATILTPDLDRDMAESELASIRKRLRAFISWCTLGIRAIDDFRGFSGLYTPSTTAAETDTQAS